MSAEQKNILVIGGGISGITVALEAAEAGYEVTLLEKSPSLGGRVAQLNLYFPKLCPPFCGLEINYRRLRSNPKIKIHTLAEVTRITGEPKNYTATVELKPRLVNEKCTACDACVAACPKERPNPFNYGLDQTKAIYLPHEMALPMRYVIDSEVCPGVSCGQCLSACKYQAIDLMMKPQTIELKAGAVVYATGWKPYPAEKIDNLGFGKIPNVITNVIMERLAAANGPTQGKILRPSDLKPVSSVAFVQCAGSRDENHLAYCSSVCCLASLKQASYVRSQYPEAKLYMFYIDLRALGRMEDFLEKIKAETGLELIKGKVAKVSEEAGTGRVTVEAEEVLAGRKRRETVDLVVLATGMMPELGANPPLPAVRDEFGFLVARNGGPGAAGTAKRPADVANSIQDATGAALKAIQTLVSPV
ncbi:MAG: heterodisulfide reductase subunit A [Deltaproteobacteria bacterium RBG_13_61_14]|nr:MAG: heterodisulfide reductase subunit A [Deltaproteobacteria bacterium RBG_13_61_14]